MKYYKIIHPYIFVIYMVLFLFSKNIDHVPFEDVFLPLIGTLMATFAIFSLFHWLIKDREKAGLETTLILFLTLSYGHMLTYLVQQGILVYDHRLLLSVYAIVFIIGVWAIWRVFTINIEVTKILNLVMVILLIQPVLQIVLFNINYTQKNTQPITISVNQFIGNQYFPDVYFILLDGYGRSDTLNNIYDYDNSDFLEFLQRKGFYIANKSRANYTQTLQSLTSTFTLNYLDRYDFLSQNKEQNNSLLESLLHNNEVLRFFEEQGYKTVSISSGFSPTQWENATYYFNSSEIDLNSFKNLYLMSTLALIFQNDLLYKMHRQLILYSFETLKEITPLPGPKFVFAHIIAPHPPFVFDSNGESIQPDRSYNLRDGNYFEGTTEEYINDYRGEIEYIEQLVIETVSYILENASSAPIIIIQGDHGPAAYFDWSGLKSNSCLAERTGILNAYLFPKDAIEYIYPEITPVNSFRILFNVIFDSGLELLPDKIYYSDASNYTFIDVTNIQTCSIP